MAPLKLGYADVDGIVNTRHIDFYERRSQYIGAVTVEPLYLDRGLREIPTQLGIDNDDKIPGLSYLVESIHQKGAKVIAHLNHPGRMANPKIPGNYYISSSGEACENGGAVPRKMDREMMGQVIGLFTGAAERAVKCGFDIIELQFGHGYLLAQFMSLAVNNRDDEFGGSFENRVRFPMDVLKSVRRAVNIPIIVRISGDEMIPEGLHTDEMIKLSVLLEKSGIEAIHVSAGSVCSTPPWFFQHMFVPKGKTWEFAARIKEHISIPVIFVGQINTSEDIRYLEEKYPGNYIALGRTMVADPDFLGKHTGEVVGNIRPCLSCSEGCLGNVRRGNGLGCCVNPEVNNDIPASTQAGKPEKIAIIGGGLAGMQAAILLKERNFDVTVFEKENLGGQFRLAYLPPKKGSLKKIIEYFVAEMDRLKIPVIYKEAGEEDILSGKFDRVIFASGAKPVVPSIKGLKEYYWTEFLDDSQLPSDNTVLVIGGGLIGLEMSSKLVDGNNRVIIVEMFDETGRGMEMLEKTQTMKKLAAHGTKIFTGHKVVEVSGEMVFIENDKNIKSVIEGIDKIIVSVGMKSYVPFEMNINIPSYFIGDACKPGKAENAISDAYHLALTLE